MQNTLLKQANIAMRNQEFESAIYLFKQALVQADARLKKIINFNLELAQKKVKLEPEIIAPTPKVEEQEALTNSINEHNLIYEMQVIEPYFDIEFYKVTYPNIDRPGIDPLRHYCIIGWREKYDPCSRFSTADYLEQYPDVEAAQINPFWHYVVAGKAEGRDSEHPAGIKAKIIKNLGTLDQKVQQWKKKEISPDLLSVKQVVYEITKKLILSDGVLVISISHDHYKKNSGGIQLCIQREEQLAHELEMLYLNVHPWQPLPILASEKEFNDPLVTLVLAGNDIGVCKSSVITESINKLNTELKITLHIIVHHLMGHSIKNVKNWIKLQEDSHCWFWLHDFFSLCPSYALQRNDISFCGAPDINSNACAICIYGDERVMHMKQIRDFFSEVKVSVISPSEATKNFWLSKYSNLTTKVKVLPHITQQWVSRSNNLILDAEKPVSIGYVGAAVNHKGWPTFEKLYQILSDDPRYQFVYFGSTKPPLSGLKYIFVKVTALDHDAVTNAIAEANIDYSIHWVNCFETFSFTTHESIAAGAFVITNPDSGNISSVIKNTGKGLVIPNEYELFKFFKDGEAERILNIIRHNNESQICIQNFSNMTLHFLTTKESI